MFNKKELKIILSGLDLELKSTYRALSKADETLELENEVEDIKRLKNLVTAFYYGEQ